MENIEAMLCAYIEGDLDAAGKSRIEKHLQENPQHRRLLDELTSMRDLVRGLPHAEAPIDLEDSLRQKVERSMLLEDSVAAAPQGPRADWWPQFFTIAAIFLLFASLCFILYKTLGPTMKPAVFTQNVTDTMPPTALADHQSSLDSGLSLAAQPQPLPASHENDIPTSIARARISPANAVLPSVQQFVAQSQQQVLSAANLDFQSIRRRLESSGYGVAGSTAGPTSQPVLMVVSSTDPPTTNAQITQFLSNNTGISWKAVPSDSELKNAATTMPAGVASEGQVQNDLAGKMPFVQTRIPATQPSNDLYVARGLTPQQADALRLTLTVPQNGQEVQVTMQSAQPLATTQPTSVSAKDDGGSWLSALASPPATEPSASANSAAELNAGATTAPSLAGRTDDARESAGAAMAGNNAGSPLLQNKSQILLPVDAVIFLQSGTVVASPTSQPSLVEPTAPIPVTRP